MDDLADQIAQATIHSKQKNVIVFNFSGPSEKTNQLGEYLAQNLSDALKKAAPSLDVLDRSKIIAACADRRVLPAVLSDPSTAIWVGAGMGAKAAVVGELSNQSDGLKITVKLYRIRDLEPLFGLQATMRVTPEMSKLLNQSVKGPAFASSGSPPFVLAPGQRGYTYPKCLRCPEAKYSQEAVDQKFQGTVVLSAVIKEDGRAYDISVLKPLPYGLTKQGIEAVTQWTFRPASTPEGIPTAAQQTIEVTFHLY
jgi:TonB family protein